MSGSTPTYQPIGEHELVLGLVYGAGADVEPVHRLLAERLQPYGYTLRAVHLSDYFPAVLGREPFNRETPNATRDLQNMGDDLRRLTDDKAVLAKLATFLMAAKRAHGMSGPGRVAWLLRSLRRPEEVDELRKLYGPRFVLLGVHVPEAIRQDTAEERRQRWATVTTDPVSVEAAADLQRDEEDRTVDYGQAMRKTFAQSDFFIDARSPTRLGQTLPRTVKLIFGEPFVPPQRDEQAMYLAFTAGLRSSEMGRQVGAAIVNDAGDLLAVGTNDVPAAGGGLAWSPDQPDSRDFSQVPPIDSNTKWQRIVARELLVRMARRGRLRDEHYTSFDGDLDITEDELDAFLREVSGTRFSAITEFGRAVHAEMDALTTAARLGVSVQDATVVCTTWPCHNCARHLIAAGITRVVYVFPYAKSLARDLHREALLIEPREPGKVAGKVVFEQFIGVAPRVYHQYFDFGQADRKSFRGRAMVVPDPSTAVPRVLQDAGPFTFGGPAVPATRTAELERQLVRDFLVSLENHPDLNIPTPSEEDAEL
jgi:deoxycytidylate deaminase